MIKTGGDMGIEVATGAAIARGPEMEEIQRDGKMKTKRKIINNFYASYLSTSSIVLGLIAIG